MNRRKSLIISLIPLVAIPLFPAVTGLYRSYLAPHMPPCVIRLFFGVYCPGCGATHCMYDLAQFRLLSALHNNLIIIAAALLLLLYWLQNLLFVFGKRVKLIPASDSFYLAAVGIALVYTVLRNFFPFLAPV